MGDQQEGVHYWLFLYSPSLQDLRQSQTFYSAMVYTTFRPETATSTVARICLHPHYTLTTPCLHPVYTLPTPLCYGRV